MEGSTSPSPHSSEVYTDRTRQEPTFEWPATIVCNIYAWTTTTTTKSETVLTTDFFIHTRPKPAQETHKESPGVHCQYKHKRYRPTERHLSQHTYNGTLNRH